MLVELLTILNLILECSVPMTSGIPKVSLIDLDEVWKKLFSEG